MSSGGGWDLHAAHVVATSSTRGSHMHRTSEAAETILCVRAFSFEGTRGRRWCCSKQVEVFG
eukprot:scaffold272266_cov30-Tisochrysis_lutea.AAC.4